MKNKVIIWDAEFIEIVPELRVETVCAKQIGDDPFAQMDWEIDSIMREIGAR